MSVDTCAAAFLAGLGTGAHCALMCGPLACALKVRPLGYHLGRVASYSLLGAVGGGLGQVVMHALKAPVIQAAPWVLLVLFAGMACGVERYLPLPALSSGLGARMRLERNLGWLTPLLPCGPLWLMFGAAAAMGSFLSGAALLLSFGMGTVALYAALQAGVFRLRSTVSAVAASRMQRGLLWGATLILGWRLWKGGGHGCCTF